MFITLMKRVAIAAAALLATAVLSGAVFELVSRQRAVRQYPVQGRLVDIGGRRLHLDCRGTGSPTVIFESGLDAMGSTSWSAVHDSVASATRACAYSRAGIIWSDPSGRPFNSDSAAADLHVALVTAGENGPWVMVGHSLGGAYVTAFTARYPEEVVGLVMLDVSHPDQFRRYEEATGRSLAPSAAQAELATMLSWTGVVRLFPSGLDGAPQAFLPLSVRGLAGEIAAVGETLAREGRQASFGDRPLVVLMAGIGPSADDRRAMQITEEQAAQVTAAHETLLRDLATWSSRGRFAVVADASHYIQRDRPDAVIAAVRSVVGGLSAR